MHHPARKPATYADLEAVPSHLVAEILDGELVTHPRPAPRHGAVQFALSGRLDMPFRRGESGPGGWIFITEPELHLGPHIMVPDIAGWRVERLPKLPETAWIETVPDWVCEILSPLTARDDRGRKRRIYAIYDLAYLWLLDPIGREMEAFELHAGKWTLLETYSGDVAVDAPPFAAVPFPLASLWPYGPDAADDLPK